VEKKEKKGKTGEKMKKLFFLNTKGGVIGTTSGGRMG